MMPTQTEPFQKDITIEENGLTAIEQLAKNTSLSKEKLKQVMQKGAVWLTRKNYTQHYDDQILSKQPPLASCLHFDSQYSIWYKPYGMHSQGSKWGDHTTIYRYAEQHLKPQRPAFIVHRLDRAASGLIIVAHTKSMAKAFSRMFENRRIIKRYQAVVDGKFPDKAQHYNDAIGDKPASSHATLFKYDVQKNRSLLEINIETGRKHQIRRHLSDAGFPLIGDRLYGDADDHSENLQLVCHYLSFKSPVDDSEKCYHLPENLLLHL